MPRLAGLRRRLAFLGGAAADRARETLHLLRPRPGGLLHATCRVDQASLTHAIAAGVRFLDQRQDRDGLLRGFCLPPGASDTWLTAHVCFVTAGLVELEPLAQRAARALAALGGEDGGWGYNRRVAVDLDSGAQALMLLERAGLDYPAFLRAKLLAAQCAAGGFPTYPRPRGAGAPAHGWQAAHAEVSAMVYAWLRGHAELDGQAARCRTWLETRCAAGALPCYWWQDDSYGLWLQARCGLLHARSTAAIARHLAAAGAAPQLAMALVAAITQGGFETHLPRAGARLLASQLADGSWPCAPCLRVTDRRCAAAGGAAAGAVYADRRRVFSTAHALAALASLRAAQGSA